jgi:hypothetical protein
MSFGIIMPPGAVHAPQELPAVGQFFQINVMLVYERRIRGSDLVCVLGGAALLYKVWKMPIQGGGPVSYTWVALLGGWLLAYGLRGLFRKPHDDF